MQPETKRPLLEVRDLRTQFSTPDGLVKSRRLPPDLIDPPAGCSFQPRCPYAIDRCVTHNPSPEPVACWVDVTGGIEQPELTVSAAWRKQDADHHHHATDASPHRVTPR